MKKSDLPDAAAREAALDPGGSFIVQAPAGSGKTELLVRRFLKLLATVERPEEILAITFTRKAAAEMRKRVLEATPEAKELGHRLRIQTIDALCASLTRQMPVLARFGAQPDLVEDARPHYREAALRTLKDLSPEAERLLAHLDNNLGTAVWLLSSMLAKRDQWLRTTGAARSRARLEASFALERARILAAARRVHPDASVEMAQRYLTKTERTWTKRPPAPPELVATPGLREALIALQEMPPERYTDDQWEVLEAILRLLPYAAAHLKVVFGETRRSRLYGSCARRRARARRPRSPYRPAARARLPRQAHPGRRVPGHLDLAVGAPDAAHQRMGARATGRTLFLVGDPMQSIYRFREAEVALFLQAREQGLGSVKLEPITLSTNFRSQKNLIAFFNASFSRILPAEADAASGGGAVFAGRPPSRQEDPRRRSRHLARAARPRSRGAARGRAGARGEGPHRDPGAKARRARRHRSGAEGRRHPLPRHRHRAPGREAGGAGPLRAHAGALASGDRIAWLSILRAPWAGLSLQDLHEIAAKDRYATMWELIQENERLERFRAILAPAIANRGRGSLRERVEGVWLALGGPACVASATDLEDAEIYLDELESLERAGELEDLAALDQSLRPALRAARPRGDRRRPADHDDPQVEGPRVRHRHRAGPRQGPRSQRYAAFPFQGVAPAACFSPR